jgi:rhodanese-related sulfurtransferase
VRSFSRPSPPEIDVDDMEALMGEGGARVLDVREEWEFRRGRVPGALNVPLGLLPQRVAELPRDKRLLVICESGSRSLAAADFLIRNCFEGTVSVRGGTSAWARSRRPMETDRA